MGSPKKGSNMTLSPSRRIFSGTRGGSKKSTGGGYSQGQWSPRGHASSSSSRETSKASPGINIRHRSIQNQVSDEISLISSPKTHSTTADNSKENLGGLSANNSLSRTTGSCNLYSPLTLDSVSKLPARSEVANDGPGTTPSSGYRSLPNPSPQAMFTLPRLQRMGGAGGIGGRVASSFKSKASHFGAVNYRGGGSDKSSSSGTPPPRNSKKVGTSRLDLHIPNFDNASIFGSPSSHYQSLPEKPSQTTHTRSTRRAKNREERKISSPRVRGGTAKVADMSVDVRSGPRSPSSPGFFGSLLDRLTVPDFDNRSETIIFSRHHRSFDDCDERDERESVEVVQLKNRERVASVSSGTVNDDDDDDAFAQIMTRDRSASELGSLCGCMITIDDVARAGFFCRAGVTEDASRKDYKGETPLHALANNKALAVVLGNPNNLEYETKDYLALYRQPTFDQDSANQLKLHTERFLLDDLLPAFPGAMIIRDNNGHIPFEPALLDWIATCRNRHQREATNATESNYLSNYTNVVTDAVNQAWESTSTTLLSAVKFGSRSKPKMTESKRQSALVDKMERGHTGYRQGIQCVAHSATGSANGGSSPIFEKPNLTPHARFCFEMLSLIVDDLDVFSNMASNSTMMFPGDLNSELQKEKYVRAVRGIQSLQDMYGPLDLCLAVVDNVASIPHLLETILSIDDDTDMEFVLSTSIMRRVLLNKHSVGPWLTTMLQNPRRNLASRAVEYLQMVSNLCSGKDPKEKKLLSHKFVSKTLDCDDLIDEVSRLPNFIPSLLSLGDSGMEEVSTTLVVRQVLNRMIARPFVATVVLCDAIFLLTVIVGLRAAVNRMIVGEPLESVLAWIYLANIGIFYFIIGEIGKAVSLFLISKHSRRYFLSFWQLIDVLAIVFALASSVAMRWQFSIYENGFEDANLLRGLLATTTGLLWLRVLSFMKAINMQLATFVLAIIQIAKDILWFCAILLTLVVSFAQMFYTVLAPASCATGEASERQCNPSEYLLKAYTVLLGDFGTFEREEFTTAFSVVLAVFFSFLVCVLLLNVLIAIASDSYEKCLLKSQKLFGRARVMLIAELASFQSLLRKRDPLDEAVVDKKDGIYSDWFSSGKWTGDWSRGSVLFFVLSTIVVVMWTIAELVGFARGEQYGSILFSLASVFVNIGLYIVMMLFLNRHSAGNKDMNDEKKEWSNILQRFVLRTLGASLGSGNEGWRRKKRPEEEWNGRVHFLQREMDRIADRQTEIVVEQSESLQNMMNQSESRLRTELTAMEERFRIFEATLLQEVQGSRETNAQMKFAVDELRALLSMAGSSSSNRSPVPSEVNLDVRSRGVHKRQQPHPKTSREKVGRGKTQP